MSRKATPARDVNEKYNIKQKKKKQKLITAPLFLMFFHKLNYEAREQATEDDGGSAGM